MRYVMVVVVTAGLWAGVAHAQDPPPDPQPPPLPGDPQPQPLPQPPADPYPPGDGGVVLTPEEEAAQRWAGATATPAENVIAAPKKPLAPVRYPFMLHSPTGRLLPGAVIYGGGGVDTGRGVTGQLEVGLGDVAEFGLAVTDLIRSRNMDDPLGDPSGIFPTILAHFKMGVAENRMFKHQPAIALGFRKSFEREEDAHRTRVAELYLTASKDLGKRTSIHGGATFWDASLDNGVSEVTLHGKAGGAVKNQIRVQGGIELRPMKDSQIMVEVFWLPEFHYSAMMPETIVLKPQLAWGVRYELSQWAVLEAGVRVPDIGDVNLLDAQIFGQFKVVTRRLRTAAGLE